MQTNDCLRRLRYILDLNDNRMIRVCAEGGLTVSREVVSRWLKRDDDEELDEAEKMPMKDEPEGKDLNKDGKKGHGKVPAFLDEKEKMDESQIRNIIRKLVKEAMNKKEVKAKSKN